MRRDAGRRRRGGGGLCGRLLGGCGEAVVGRVRVRVRVVRDVR